tara:strand:+ start:3285 stop:3500 length:216 start_codon:yes stop_codon:yes gene_type:complete
VKIVSVACDGCGTADGKRTVTQYSLRRGTRRWTGELCDKCFDKLIKEWNPSDLPRGHHQIVETKMEDIVKA